MRYLLVVLRSIFLYIEDFFYFICVISNIMTEIRSSHSIFRYVLAIFLVLTLISAIWANIHSIEYNDHSDRAIYHSSNVFPTTFGSSTRNQNTTYTYHNYTELVSDMRSLNNTYPDLFELYSAQAEFGLPECKDGYKIWYARITNESRGFNKPEVLFIGGHHGNEPISVEAPYYLMEFLLQNYESNATIRYLLDHREIYIMPVINPWGWENNVREDPFGEDLNRDYPYGIASGNIPLTTVGARAVAELSNRHLFILALTWHSGDHLIYYAWGTPIHDTGTDESPDDAAFYNVAKLMSNYAGGSIKYPYGPANQAFYSGGVFGAWSDYAYASGWDTSHVESGFNTTGLRSIAMGIEISTTKSPSEGKLGSPEEITAPNGQVGGFIPQNIRMALVMIDLAEPYLTWRNLGSNNIPDITVTGEKLDLSWYVNGSFEVTNTTILYGSDPDPINNYEYSTLVQAGNSHWNGKYFVQELEMPEKPDDYYFVACAQVDQNAVVQNDPEPGLSPQSYFVHSRTNDSWSVANNENTISGSKFWYSTIIHTKIVNKADNIVNIQNYTPPAFCNEQFNITWLALTDGTINHTEVYWGQDPDIINHSEQITSFQAGATGIFNTTITIPSRPGYYYFIAHLNLVPNSSIKSKGINDHWSQIIEIEIKPKIPYKLNVSLPQIEYTNGYRQTLSIKGITCSNQTISEKPLNDSLMIEHRVIVYWYEPPMGYIGGLGSELKNRSYELIWSAIENYWYLPTLNVSNWLSNDYMVVGQFKHRYGEGIGFGGLSGIENKHWFKLEHIIVVHQPDSIFNNNTNLLNLVNITAWCSNSQYENISGAEANEYYFEIRYLENESTILTYELTWSEQNRSWFAVNVNLSVLPEGTYFVISKFYIRDIGFGESSHTHGDETEFDIKNQTTTPLNREEPDQEKEDNDQFFSLVLMGITMIFLIIVILFILVLYHIRKKY